MTHLTSENARVRAVAGLLLKNISKTLNTSPPEVIDYVKSTVLHAFTDPVKEVRDAAGQVIVTLLGVLEVTRWPEALVLLLKSLDSPDQTQQAVEFSSLPQL